VWSDARANPGSMARLAAERPTNGSGEAMKTTETGVRLGNLRSETQSKGRQMAMMDGRDDRRWRSSGNGAHAQERKLLPITRLLFDASSKPPREEGRVGQSGQSTSPQLARPARAVVKTRRPT
jgi:hypothetical protein